MQVSHCLLVTTKSLVFFFMVCTLPIYYHQQQVSHCLLVTTKSFVFFFIVCILPIYYHQQQVSHCLLVTTKSFVFLYSMYTSNILSSAAGFSLFTSDY